MINKLSGFYGLLVGVASSLYVYWHHSLIDSFLFAVLISVVPLLVVGFIAVFLDDDFLHNVLDFVSFLPVGVLISSILIFYLYLKKIFH